MEVVVAGRRFMLPRLSELQSVETQGRIVAMQSRIAAYDEQRRIAFELKHRDELPQPEWPDPRYCTKWPDSEFPKAKLIRLLPAPPPPPATRCDDDGATPITAHIPPWRVPFVWSVQGKEHAFKSGRLYDGHPLTGSIKVMDILVGIFLFIPADDQTLLALCSVSHAWRAAADGLPHWGFTPWLVDLYAPFVRTGRPWLGWFRSLLPLDAGDDVVSREGYIAAFRQRREIVDYIRQSPRPEYRMTADGAVVVNTESFTSPPEPWTPPQQVEAVTTVSSPASPYFAYGAVAIGVSILCSVLSTLGNDVVTALFSLGMSVVVISAAVSVLKKAAPYPPPTYGMQALGLLTTFSILMWNIPVALAVDRWGVAASLTTYRCGDRVDSDSFPSYFVIPQYQQWYITPSDRRGELLPQCTTSQSGGGWRASFLQWYAQRNSVPPFTCFDQIKLNGVSTSVNVVYLSPPLNATGQYGPAVAIAFDADLMYSFLTSTRPSPVDITLRSAAPLPQSLQAEWTALPTDEFATAWYSTTYWNPQRVALVTLAPGISQGDLSSRWFSATLLFATAEVLTFAVGCIVLFRTDDDAQRKLFTFVFRYVASPMTVIGATFYCSFAETLGSPQCMISTGWGWLLLYAASIVSVPVLFFAWNDVVEEHLIAPWGPPSADDSEARNELY